MDVDEDATVTGEAKLGGTPTLMTVVPVGVRV